MDIVRNFLKKTFFRLFYISTGLILLIVIVFYFYYTQISRLKKNIFQLHAQEKTISQNLIQTKKELDASLNELMNLKNQDQYKINKTLEGEINNINTIYKKAVSLYE